MPSPAPVACSVAVLAVAVAAGCGGTAATDVTCDALRARVVECAKQPWPPGALERMHRYCAASVAYAPEPRDRPGNLAERAKAQMIECGGAVTCADLDACFAKHRCQLVVAGPGAPPELQCR